ncbi:MAG: rhodanese-like domain-containing protein, partial [Cyclobacteriaceae bacterium]
MSSISPSEFFKWDRPRLLVDIRPIGAFLKGSIQGAISLPIVGQDPVEDFRRYAKSSSISRPLHLIDQHGRIASQLCHDKHSKFLQGGYKNFKAWRNKQFEEGPPVSVLGGYTGSGKTKILLALKNLGHQV